MCVLIQYFVTFFAGFQGQGLANMAWPKYIYVYI